MQKVETEKKGKVYTYTNVKSIKKIESCSYWNVSLFTIVIYISLRSWQWDSN